MPGFSCIGVGCGRVGSLSNDVPLAEIRKTMLAAADAGITTFDTANIYGQGDSERLLGRLFGHRSDIAIVTKAGQKFTGRARLAARIKPVLRIALKWRARLRKHRRTESGSAADFAVSAVKSLRSNEVSQDFLPEALDASLNGSLRRLRRARVDAFLLHDPSPATIRDPAVVALLARIKAEGRAGRVGVSINVAEDLEAVADTPGYDIVQAPMVLLDRMLDSGAYRSLLDRGVAIHVRQVLRPHGGTGTPDVPAAIARARELPGVETVLIGMSRSRHLAEVAGCAD